MSDTRTLNHCGVEYEEANSGDEDGSETSSEDVPASPCSFERIVSVSDTPWAEFFLCVGRLMLWLVAFLAVQVFWTVHLKSQIDLAYLPVSIVLVPVAFWRLRRTRCLSVQRLAGLQYLAYFMFRRNRFCHSHVFSRRNWLAALHEDPPETLGQQVEEAWATKQEKGGRGYNLTLLSCTLIFWTLLVGQSCWPCGYVYLTHYGFARCQYLCQAVNMSIPVADNADAATFNDSFQLTIGSGSMQMRADLLGNCSERLGFVSHEAYPSEAWRRWSDPHWLIRPEGAWVLGQQLQGLHFHYTPHEGTRTLDPDCSRFYLNTLIIGIMILLIAGFAATMFLDQQGLLVASVSVVVAILCATGVGKVWMHAVHCRRSSLHNPDSVFSHLLHSCMSVVTYNGTFFGSSMYETGHKLAAYESNFRRLHQIARSEAHFGSFCEVFILMLVVAAHSTFRWKKMQTGGASLHLLSKRDKLFRYMLDHWDDFLDSLPAGARTSIAWALHRVYELHTEKDAHLEERISNMMGSEPSKEDLDEALSSFWPALLYALVRALIPSVFRQFVPIHGITPAVPEYNSLWMLNSVSVVLMNVVVYLFVLFQVQEATRRYVGCMQIWLQFESAWNFPSQASLAGDALMEIVQVQVQGDEEVVEMLDNGRKFLGDFSCEHVSSEGHRDGKVVNVRAVREGLPTWWAWREYLIIDYTDKRVRLELHLFVVFAMLLISAAQLFLDNFRDGIEMHELIDADGTMNWLDSHVTALTLQTAWDILFLMVPLLHAIHCAATMNRMIESQLQSVVYLQELLDHDPGDVDSEAGDSQRKADLGPQVRGIFSMAKSELDKGGPATKLLNTFTINKQMFAVVGTVLSVFGGGQAVEIFQTITGTD